ncbi:hypothetical protein CANARDRAFT_224794 [[Candida] arabinofermentans NRRL YB-2248]|uniref:Zn(2)-C6 fungal-type domain-containing protein n=1 Tax=[Candida] arabinofermentans NRRL YB-2248 TaxID=983967 RepID=A0A1E4SWH9_9ASCO|nr:hypothetical protein CANARDRAFT_224794 [[Candida] arabinofermentans NRRL YB-2248]
MKGLKKSRSGCCCCKRRKKKCDGGKPQCSNCIRLKLDCEYPIAINWCKENQITLSSNELSELSKNTTRSSTGMIYVTDIHLINFTSWEVNLANLFSNSKNNDILRKNLSYNGRNTFKTHLSIDLSQDTTNSPELPSHLSHYITEEYLFSYYDDYLSETKSFYFGAESNEFREIIIPGCLRFTGLYYSVLALAAIDLMKKESVKPIESQNKQLMDSYYFLFFKYKNEAINQLHNVIDDIDVSEIDAIEELAITMMILCSAEITNQGNKSWVNYLKEGCLIFSTLSQDQILGSSILSFVYKYFSLRFIFLIGTLKKEKMDEFLNACNWIAIDAIFDSDEIDHLFGCSPRLVYIIYKLIMLNHSRDSFLVDEKKLTKQYLEIWNELENLNQISTKECRKLYLCANSYYLATKVYFCTLLWSGKLRIYSEYGIASIYHQLLAELTVSLTELSMITTQVCFPTWCMFIRSLCDTVGVNGEVNRLHLLSICTKLDLVSPLGSCCEVRRAMETVWKVYDLTIEDPINFLINEKNFFLKFDYRDILKEGDFMLALT